MAATIDRENIRSGITRALATQSEPLPPPERAQHFGECFARFGDAQVVLLGEATHGTSEFYRARAAITRELVRNHGFTIVAVEADWPDAARIDRYVRHHAPKAVFGDAFTRFPTWMWRNVEVVEFLDWLESTTSDYRRSAAFHSTDLTFTASAPRSEQWSIISTELIQKQPRSPADVMPVLRLGRMSPPFMGARSFVVSRNPAKTRRPHNSRACFQNA